MIENDTSPVLDRLLGIMEGDQGFPALSSTIGEINQIVASESESASKLTMAILQDFALTNKLLRLVNTVSYGQFGGQIHTVSKAVVILGFETVRNVAMTLILLEFLQNKSQAATLREDVLGSFFAGLVAKKLESNRNMRDGEEAMICAMFHNLGKLLATFYFYDESQQVAQLMEQGLSESQASCKVLGISYDDLGIGIARSWNFPDRLQEGMRKISGEKITKPRGEIERLTVMANLANELCEIAANTPPEGKDAAIGKLMDRYREASPLTDQHLNKALEHSLEEISARATILNLPTTNSRLLKAVLQWSGHTPEPEAPPAGDQAMSGIVSLDMVADTEKEPIKLDPEAILGAGIQDVTNALVSDYQLNDILQMVLETMLRGMRFNRVLFIVRDNKSGTMRARFGFGEAIDSLLPKFHFPIKFEPDVFHVALEKGVDIVIEDVMAENIASKIPAWFHDAVSAQCFLLLPVMINNNPIGLIYADMPLADSLQITPGQLGLLRTLRNQTVLAIRQKP